MKGWREALARTRKGFGGVLASLVGSKSDPNAESLEALEEALVLADVPVRVAMKMLEELEHHDNHTREHLRDVLLRTLGDAPALTWESEAKPFSVLVVGVNGSGKTTTCAKLARRIQLANLKPLLAAADTFRAAGSDQLQLWADRLGCDSVGGATGADSAAVAFDAFAAAQARGADVLIVDTAGRMHNRKPLMDELEKIRRALGKQMDRAPHETWIVLDAATGQNAVLQAKAFNELVPLTGVIVTKLDGSSKAGFLFSVAQELGVPIRFAGLGEEMDDLVPFDPNAFVTALLDLEPEPVEG